jgi:outer membrane immunogenic protein
MKHLIGIRAHVAAVALLVVGGLGGAPASAQMTGPGTWTGFYVGGNGGWVDSPGHIRNTGTDTGPGGLGGSLTVGLIPTTVSLGDSGWLGGAQIGFNSQISPMWVVGLEGDFDWIDASRGATVGPIVVAPFDPVTTTYRRQLDWLATVRGRVGVTPMPSLLLFGTGGLALGETRIGNAFICPTCGPPTSTEPGTANQNSYTRAGWTVGAGAEWMFAPRWSLKVEYLYVDLGDNRSTITYTYGAYTSSLTSTVHDYEHIVRAGVNFHF